MLISLTLDTKIARIIDAKYIRKAITSSGINLKSIKGIKIYLNNDKVKRKLLRSEERLFDILPPFIIYPTDKLSLEWTTLEGKG